MKLNKHVIWIALLFSSILITSVGAVIYHFINMNMTIDAEFSPVVFTSGDDTATCGGDISTNTSATFSSIPLGIGANITITELVNVTNSDTSGHTVPLTVDTEDFGSELKILLLYLVSPTGSETLILRMDDSGAVETEGVSVNIPASEEWAIKLVGCYDGGTSSSQSNSLNINIKVEG